MTGRDAPDPTSPPTPPQQQQQQQQQRQSLPSETRSTGVTVALLAIPVAMLAGGLALVLPALVRPPAEPPRTAAPKPSAKPPRDEARKPPAPPPAAPRTGDGLLALADAVQLVTPSTPWREVAPDAVLTRIGFGSCLHQNYPQPIWTSVLAAKPQLFLMMGDNVYGDIRSADARELVEAYRRQLAQREFAAARAALPMLGIWDDHDFGMNDASAAFRERAASTALFRAYWQQPQSPATAGVHASRIFGPEGRRVQVILLDTRSFRSPFAPRPDDLALYGKYGPDPDPSKTMLGDAQWAWLEAELRKPADVRLVVSSIQVLSNGHAFERWGNLPRERDRLIGLIERTKARGVVLLSGDRHLGAIYNRPIAAGQLLIEITSSSLNRSYGPARDVATAELVSDLHHVENFGVIDIDWTSRRLSLSLRGLSGEVLEMLSLQLADLGTSK